MAPPFSHCFRPQDYEDVKLFVDREKLIEHMQQCLRSLMDPDVIGESSLFVVGSRGVGKSILTRKALHEVIRERGPLYIAIDCAKLPHGTEPMLRELARKLAYEAIENVSENKAPLRTSAELLLRLASKTQVKVKEVRTWSSELRLGFNAKSKFTDALQLDFGMTRQIGKTRQVEESFERTIDSDYLRRLIEDFVTDCAEADERVILFIDNLDQVRAPEKADEITKVTDLARYLIGLRRCLLIATLRSEFIGQDLLKLQAQRIDVPGMQPDELQLVARRRMGLTSPAKQGALRDAGFPDLFERLSTWTQNPWGFLTWLSLFDTTPQPYDAQRSDSLVQVLVQRARTQYSALTENELRRVAAAYRDRPNEDATQSQLAGEGVDAGLLGRAVQHGLLHPDWLLDPQRYALAPFLHFLSISQP